MKCQNCGFEVAQGELFCGNCGAKVERLGTIEVKLCENCGSKMSQTEKFCGVCGHSNNDFIEGKARKKQNSRVLIVCVVILIALILIASAIIFYILTMKNDEEPNISINEEINNTQQFENNNELSNSSETVRPIVNDEYGTDFIENNEVDQVEYDRDDEDDGAEIPIDEPNNSEVYDDYLFSSDKEYITIEYLSTLTKAEIGLIRNEIYARHGYVFETEEYANYFKSKSWYHADPNFDPYSLSEIELTNVNTILAYEKQMGWR